MSSDSKYQIEFYELSDDDHGSSFYETNKTNFENKKASGALETSVNIGNYDKYTLSGGGKYQVVSRIANTAIYVDVNENYKDDVKSILDELGY